MLFLQKYRLMQSLEHAIVSALAMLGSIEMSKLSNSTRTMVSKGVKQSYLLYC